MQREQEERAAAAKADGFAELQANLLAINHFNGTDAWCFVVWCEAEINNVAILAVVIAGKAF